MLCRHHSSALWCWQVFSWYCRGRTHQEERAVPRHQQRLRGPVEAPVPAMDQSPGPPDLQVLCLVITCTLMEQ